MLFYKILVKSIIWWLFKWHLDSKFIRPVARRSNKSPSRCCYGHSPSKLNSNIFLNDLNLNQFESSRRLVEANLPGRASGHFASASELKLDVALDDEVTKWRSSFDLWPLGGSEVASCSHCQFQRLQMMKNCLELELQGNLIESEMAEEWEGRWRRRFLRRRSRWIGWMDGWMDGWMEAPWWIRRFISSESWVQDKRIEKHFPLLFLLFLI